MHIIYSRFIIYILEILNSESPDLNPLDFYVWGYLKDKVYAIPVLTRDDLVQRIQEACNEMRQNPNQVSDAVNSLIRRCHKCIEVGGQHFEQLRFYCNRVVVFSALKRSPTEISAVSSPRSPPALRGSVAPSRGCVTPRNGFVSGARHVASVSTPFKLKTSVNKWAAFV
ncbi:hypothetical protein NQ315_010979 [Exocentrus adspersus]|uniref:Uncharacterized protein n=1 Tax=Exocentrus adspersus TaxID=1586481 RepID=A0AAV8VHF4_9CUCU|nr:hypothetical protein NQ315_010979 [Exocentrus adspersus]